MIIDYSKPVTLVTVHSHAVDGKAAKEITIAPGDRASLDPAGIEFEHAASGARYFIPWSEVIDLHQP